MSATGAEEEKSWLLQVGHPAGAGYPFATTHLMSEGWGLELE